LRRVTIGEVIKKTANEAFATASKAVSGERDSWNETDGWDLLPRDIGLATAIFDGINPDIAHVGMKGEHATSSLGDDQPTQTVMKHPIIKPKNGGADECKSGCC